MGITLVEKGKTRLGSRDLPKALILAGGAVTGGAFKVGGLKAFNDYLTNFAVNDFDIFVGISSGSLIATPLIAGISPEEMLRSLDGTSKYFSYFSSSHFYRLNFREIVSRPVQFLYRCITCLPGAVLNFITALPSVKSDLKDAFLEFIRQPSVSSYEAFMQIVVDVALSTDVLPSWLHLLPSGIFDNSPIEKYIRENIERNNLTNSFVEAMRLTGKRLYISAMTLDGAKRVVFGPDEKSDVTISQAIQASTALPGFYKPARINGVDYVDGGVRETANIDIAVEKGAKLVVCYNPFRPFDNRMFQEYLKKEEKFVSQDQRLSDSGVMAVLNQIFRTFFHSRLHAALNRYRQDPDFDGDIILIEPKADDVAFFELNPLAFGNRYKAAYLGFISVKASIDEHYDDVAKVLGRYGIRMGRRHIDEEQEKLIGVKGDEAAIMRILEEDRSSRLKRLEKRYKK